MVLTITTGALELAVATTDDQQQAPKIYREAIAAIGPALDLPKAAQDQASAAAGSSVDTTADLGWGSLTVKTALPSSADESGATLRAAGSATASLGASGPRSTSRSTSSRPAPKRTATPAPPHR